jgi:spore coat polysaccharide biosynthesis protein SpsF
MTALILQARLDSTRLPGKSLLPLGDEPLVFRVMEALAFVPCGLRILACPEDSRISFEPLAQRAGFSVCTGSKEDVLGRFCAVIKKYSLDRVIRATADNPFVFTDAAAAIAQEAAETNADYACYAGIPIGSGVEAVSADALLRAEREAKQPQEREHVCPYLYGNPELFRLHRPLAPSQWQSPSVTPPLSLTVDTMEDYLMAKDLYETLSRKTHGADRYRGTKIMEVITE